MNKTAMKKPGRLCRLFGSTPRMKILEVFLEGKEQDYSSTQVATLSGMNRVTTYNNIRQLNTDGLLKISRTVGKTKMFALTNDNAIQQLRKHYDNGAQ